MKKASFRDDFPMMSAIVNGKPLIYLDSAATTHKPRVVIDAISDFYSNHYGTVHRAVYSLSTEATERYDAVRTMVKDFINAPSEDNIVFTRGTTDGINLVASSFGKAFIAAGDEIVISQIEHHSNIVPWQMVCHERGAILKVIPVDDNGEIILEEYSKLLTDKTRIVAIAHVANSIGTIHPIKKIIDMAHDAGAKILIDGAQSVPHMSVDVEENDADFYAFSGHKVYGPTGIGVLYGKYDLLESLPPYQGGGDMVQHVTFDDTIYGPPPIKFEAGTPPIAEVIGLGAAIGYVAAIGMDVINDIESELLEYAMDGMQQIPGLTILGPPRPRRGAIISFVVDGAHPLDIGTMLDAKGIAIRTGQHCAEPSMHRFNTSSTARVSLAFYNNISDIDTFIAALRDTIAFLRW